MAALTGASWTVTAVQRFRETQYRRVATMTLPAGSDTYPSGGIPWPSAQAFGFRSVLRSLVPLTPMSSPTDGDDVIVNMDQAARTVRMFRIAAGAWDELATSAAPAAAAVQVEAWGS